VPAQQLTGLKGTFLGDIDQKTLDRLLSGARVRDVKRGDHLFPDSSQEHTGVLLIGIARAYFVGPDGRQLTLRYARPRSLVTASTTGVANNPLTVHLQAVNDVTVIDLDFDFMVELQASNVGAIRALHAESARRLADVYRSFASTYYGSLRERLAAHLLDSAESGESASVNTLSAPVTQQDLAVALGSAREVVSRTLQLLQTETIVELRRGSIDILDPRRLIAAAGGWWMPSRAFALDGSSADASFDGTAQPVIAIDVSGDVIYANPAITETFGSPPRDIVGTPASRLLSDGCASEFLRSVADLGVMQSGALGLVGSYRGRRADGAEFPVDITIMPVRPGGPAAAFATFVDLTYRTALRSRIDAAQQVEATTSARHRT
jgi:CRP/FNR family transcriptional regulator